MRFYLDCCCYNRPFDDSMQDSVRNEVNAIRSIVKRVAASHEDFVIGSEILTLEFNAMKSGFKKNGVLMLYNTVTKIFVPLTREIEDLAEKIRGKSSIHLKDSLHLASAEFGQADVFLTTDYRLIRSCKNLSLKAKVFNPVDYEREVNLK